MHLCFTFLSCVRSLVPPNSKMLASPLISLHLTLPDVTVDKNCKIFLRYPEAATSTRYKCQRPRPGLSCSRVDAWKRSAPTHSGQMKREGIKEKAAWLFVLQRQPVAPTPNVAISTMTAVVSLDGDVVEKRKKETRDGRYVVVAKQK
ncbi:hypothetical protein PMAYCL1PPCAC_33310 [Pristionchus mayeri]|uniref:Uncharacterized protein n=1 Tax=Pristionchus mayeri TaxID=1317129 RepID=A0AAN5DIE9_9BILA|nr:hypothetical protein PMAYCL1PPCAC_33310 [Pristionchus mayeri]